MGGHKLYPKNRATDVYIEKDRLVIEKLDLIIPFKTIMNIENMDEKKIKALRVVALGLVFLPLAIVGAIWKKKYLYTVLHYNDRLMDQTIVLDFDKDVERAQRLIYERMIKAKE